jgi:signal transduction histidine kinase
MPPSAAKVVEFPARRLDEQQLEHELVLALATADDVESGMARVVERTRHASAAAGVEWWGTDEGGTLELVVAAGAARRRRESLPLGHVGVVVVHGGELDAEVASALVALLPILRRRVAEERLARTTALLARRNEALEDFAALVAHELKTPLQAALVAEDASSPVEEALLLVDALLEAARSEPRQRAFTSPGEPLAQAVADLRAEVEITADLATALPLPPGPLRVILRNLFANAVAAGARHVHVTAVRSTASWQVFVDDDGVGLAEVDRYAAGSGLGLSLCRRIAARFGGLLELAPRLCGGTRATLEFVEVAR